MEPEWPCFRLVAERYVTWSDLENMSLDDVDLLWQAIDDLAAGQRAAEKARASS